ncbi:MAG: glutamate racemase [Candidatus Promineifilaceae bacterium]|nr:glutamate racemase [Candidatus Promineifilaceae bacterium]
MSNQHQSHPAPIALFDSGVGGLSVLRSVRRLLPAEPLLYLADQAHVPYGGRPAAQVRTFSEAVTHFFLDRGAKLIVVACNTATAAALGHLRAAFPHVPFVGMEPAVKPGAAQTRSGKVGVLATAGTFESQRYASLMHRFARDVTLYEDPCTGLVPLIEAGQLDTPATEQLLRRCLSPMLAAGVDTLVLGCTHYPFVLPLIRHIAGEDVAIIDPAPAVARQVQRVLTRHNLIAPAPSPTIHAFTTGDPGPFTALASRLLGHPLPTTPLHWRPDATLHPTRDTSHTV